MKSSYDKLLKKSSLFSSSISFFLWVFLLFFLELELLYSNSDFIFPNIYHLKCLLFIGKWTHFKICVVMSALKSLFNYYYLNILKLNI